ncbi:LacI family DNA-binding transcriptional regulator [uncultured Flavonifractor sp.]|uniref:LacI family DNA-binding transcriptional regulator n=1 Tax=uncultured Flavonifractor sp. TaxID=1193534 RepID=UPI00261B810A|nr:LacI family DNA-binding transcriptional regulator [uncultured Flavonifractor sp.]
MNIYDIAEKAGVSVATVSRVINNSKNVSEQSKNKVMEVINQEKYVPNIFARNLNSSSSKTIGILCPIISDINHVKPVSILEHMLREAGYDILLCCTDSVSENKTKYLNLLHNRRVDAIILIGSTVEEVEHYEHFVPIAAEIPILIINGLVELDNVYCILSNERAAIQQLVCALHQAGCSRILYLNDTCSFSGYQKILGYKDGLQACHLEEQPELILQIPEADDELTLSQQMVLDFLETGPTFDALIAADDILAVGAQKALLARNIHIPIIGFNNSRFAQCASPELTSIDTNMETICATATHILMEVLQGHHPASSVLISTRLIQRDSFRISDNP